MMLMCVNDEYLFMISALLSTGLYGIHRMGASARWHSAPDIVRAVPQLPRPCTGGRDHRGSVSPSFELGESQRFKPALLPPFFLKKRRASFALPANITTP